jgi:hypothetical protein
LPGGGQCAPRYDRKDIDNNLTTDLLIHNGATGETQVWYMNGINRTGFDNFDPFLNLPDSQPWRLLGVGDFNQDGHPDILIHNIDSGAFQAWYMDGINRTSWGDFDPYLSVPDSTGWRVVGIADFNHDGRIDIVIHNGVTGETQIWYMNGINRTSFDNLDASLNVADSSGWRPVGTGDFNLDGQVDFLWHNGDTGEIQVWYMNGITRASFDNFDPYFNIPDSTGWRLVGTDDYNFDGRPDLLWHNGDTGGTQAWYMNGINRTDFADFDPYLSIPDSSGWRFLNPTQ